MLRIVGYNGGGKGRVSNLSDGHGGEAFNGMLSGQDQSGLYQPAGADISGSLNHKH